MPKFSFQVTPAVKKEKGWEVTALATVLYGNRPPEPSEEVVFDVNGGEFERVETNPDSGIASSVMLLQPGGYVVTAYRLKARDDRRSSRFVIREEEEKELTPDDKKTADLKAKTELVRAEKELEKIQGKTDSDEQALKSERIQLERAKVFRELKEVTQEKSKKLLPTDFIVEKVGDKGKYKLVIFVFSKEKLENIGVGIPEATVTIFDKHTGQSWETKTGPGGTVIFELPEFIEREKIIAVTVEGLPFVKDRQLLGPKTPARP